MSTEVIHVDANETVNGIPVDRIEVFKALGLNPRDPKTQALLIICDRYKLDPVLKHVVLISGNAYVTRDGYLAIAHRSGKFDGMEVLEAGETDSHYTAKVAVYRRDMTRPFSYLGRYPKTGHIAKAYGPEMAVKVAEVQALRRAFNVTGISAADEMWDRHSDEAAAVTAPTVSPAPPEHEPFTDDNATLVHFGDRINFYDEMRKALPGMKKADIENLRHAIVHRGTKGRTASSEAVVAGEEWDRCQAVWKAFMDGKLELVEDPEVGIPILVKVDPPAPEAS